MALENQFPDTQQLDACVALATDGVATCTDRARLCLIQMSLSCSLCESKYIENHVKIENFEQQLQLLNGVVRFVSDIKDSKIVYDLNKSMFLPLTSFYPEGVEVDYMEDKIDVNYMSAHEREELVAQMSSIDEDSKLRLFTIQDEVEDILLIANTLSDRKLAKFDDVGMLHRGCASLKNYLIPAIRYVQDYLNELETAEVNTEYSD